MENRFPLGQFIFGIRKVLNAGGTVTIFSRQAGEDGQTEDQVRKKPGAKGGQAAARRTGIGKRPGGSKEGDLM
ncbi:hypothetical protein [Paenibacillus stellifer]|uniref:hypothetical protein n=1 Tax=Paenibacillus stellifer TaxID=169760 RepID=UPI001470654C|nr:hypothetical protein [Paenibacillus stellifer]